jgi:hypothetical protein
MSRISDLKNSPKNQINLIKIFESFISDTKYITMYQKLYKEMLNKSFSTMKLKETLVKYLPTIDNNKLDKLSDLEIIFMYQLLTQIIPIEANKDFIDFCRYNDENKIKNNDLHSYCSFSEICDEVKIIKDKEEEKLLEKQIIKLLDNDEWLILKPLSFKASIKYGAETKWCTASKNDKTYFNQYTKNGILIYIINKKTNIKSAIHKKLSNKKTTYWDVTDNEVDVFTIGLSTEAFVAISKGVDSESNYVLSKKIDIDGNLKATPKKKRVYKNKSELLKEVEAQYKLNDRWAEYLGTLSSKNTDAYMSPTRKKTLY